MEIWLKQFFPCHFQSNSSRVFKKHGMRNPKSLFSICLGLRPMIQLTVEKRQYGQTAIPCVMHRHGSTCRTTSLGLTLQYYTQMMQDGHENILLSQVTIWFTSYAMIFVPHKAPVISYKTSFLGVLLHLLVSLCTAESSDCRSKRI